jgi:hypothetical protein
VVEADGAGDGAGVDAGRAERSRRQTSLGAIFAAESTSYQLHSRCRLELKGGASVGSEREFAMQHNIIQANIDRFKLLLKAETDPTKRAMEIRLLAEEEAKLMPKLENKEP